MGPVPEIRREKVFLQPGMSTAEVMKTYGLSSDQAYTARVEGVLRQELLEKADSHRQGEFQFRSCLSAGQEGLWEKFFKEPFSPVHL